MVTYPAAAATADHAQVGGCLWGVAVNAVLPFHTEVKAAVSGQLPGSVFGGWGGGLGSPTGPPTDRVLQRFDYRSPSSIHRDSDVVHYNGP